MPADPYFKQTVPFTFNRQDYIFNVSQELFSSHDVDIGTQRLLRSFLNSTVHSPQKILDLGCGYGPIGIVLKKQNPNVEVHFVDRDALALRYARLNCEQNQAQENCYFYASLGYDLVKARDFDLIVSNIPAKVGEKVLRHFLLDAQFHLAKNGVVAVVIVDAIADTVDEILTHNENVQVLVKKSWPGHRVYHYSFGEKKEITSTSAFEGNSYERSAVSFMLNDKEVHIKTTYHLREFDELGYDTRQLLTNIRKLSDSQHTVTIVNPGQGYIPVAVAKWLQPQLLLMIDRDLQALQISQENLILNGYPAEEINLYHQALWEQIGQKSSAVIGVVPEKQNARVNDVFLTQLANGLKENGEALFSSTSTTITRLEGVNKDMRLFDVVWREKSKGNSTLLMRKK